MDEESDRQRSIRTVAMVGNHLPRQCGIATFTTHLSCARYGYPARVRFEIAEGDVAAYRRAADFLNVNGVDVVSVQHEYGIFGAKAGENVLALLRELRMPVVTTLHTITTTPSAAQRAVMAELVALSERLVVMSNDSATVLHELHGVDPAKIDVVPHGIRAAIENETKGDLGVEGRPVLLTFGLLSPDKGIEYVIDALPAIVARHPNVVYVVLGATHPHVKQHHGETYRHMLESRALRLGVSGNILFYNRFVSDDELATFLGAADIYITPYLQEAQSTSGTLAYAVGCGKAVISTPYRYARELLADGRGRLVPSRDAGAIARDVTALLDDPAQRAELQQRAAAFGRSMSWPIVARSYVDSFERAARSHGDRRRHVFESNALAMRRPALPEIDLSHVRAMTDDTGMLQHATFSVPRYRDGYCTDDNARALLLTTLVEEEGQEPPQSVRVFASRYLAFLTHALDEKSGRFRNFLSYERAWRDEPGSEDCHGRAIWALGTVIARSADPGRHGLGMRLFHAALPAALELGSPRAWAYTLLGVAEYLSIYGGDSKVESVGSILAHRLVERYNRSRTPGWPWFEDRLTYCNARLPQAALASAAWLRDDDMKRIGETSLEWLATQYSSQDDAFEPVGSNGFYVRGGTRAAFDQQPVEACGMVSACLAAHRATDRPRWLEHARRAFEWFLGQNALRVPVFDAATGGCRDGIHVDRMNENQGAESTLSFLLAVAEMRAADRALKVPS
jgi:glycosyltransferase involved in cell wall biosynthesis